MIKYRCQLCGRIHYGRADLKPGYCTTCGPRGKLIIDINWEKVNREMITIFNRGTEAFRELAKTIEEVGRIKLWR